MKVFAENSNINEFLLQNHSDGIEIVNNIADAHYIITGKYDSNKYHSNLKGIIIPYTGHNNINLDDMREKDLMLFITPTRSKYVAEKALTLTLSLLGNTVYYHNQLKEGNWSSRNSDSRFPWTSIQNLKVGFFGFGRIGRLTHKLMLSLGCSFATIDRNKEYPKDIQLVQNLTELIQVSDIIIISTPINETTKGIFNKAMFSLMENKYLINVGRGKICNEKDLYDSLKNKKLKGYASDVWFNYPKGKENQLPSEYPIYDLDNVVLSNHSGGFTSNTNQEVNEDLLKTLIKISNKNYNDKLDLEKLI